MSYKSKDLLRNNAGEPIPQSWSDSIGDFVPTKIDDRLADIERTQQQILDKLNGTINTDFSGNVNIENAHIDNTPENPLYTQLTGSNVELIEHRIVESRNTNNLWIGNRDYEELRSIFGIDVSQYKKINMLIINRTERPILLTRLYYGTQFDMGESNTRILCPLGNLPINDNDFLFIGANIFNEHSDLKDFFNIPLPYFVFHLFRGTEEVMGDGEIEFKLFGLK